MTVRMRLRITGMHCDHCIKSIESALATLHGVESCAVLLGEADVTIDESTVGKKELLAAVRGAGVFDVSFFSSPAS
ncbi:MAG: heavy-metal-associated domain-containing protein [Planctomycetes bacterium]|nr:heavy-metal-associated domain-containing protein [Planctomycetota bacterium]MCH7703968.1 heavy-metal-associated domain-containing protein [Planctomycetota bacterium]